MHWDVMEKVNRKKKLRRRLLETSKYWARPVLDGVLEKWRTKNIERCQYLTPILIIHAIFSPTIIPWRFQHDMQRAWVFKTGLGESQP
jgi:mannose/fructose/N-acetylgalactosamine-specific phosphotransferase system component IIC